MNYIDRKVLLVIATISFVSLIAFTTMSSVSEEPNGSDENTDRVSSLEKVETQYVCMVNNQLFPNEQIPVEVEGKTYYGCCEMCKEQLQNRRDLRYDLDPVSGKRVDKATAVIGVNKEGKAYYFENRDNLIYFNNREVK